MKHSVDTALAGDAKTALASKGVHGVAASSDWASLTLKGTSSSKTAALTAVHKMGNAGAVNTVKYICTDAGPCNGKPAGTAGGAPASGTAAAAPSASASSSAGATASPSASAPAGAAKAKDITGEISKKLGTAGVGFGTGSATLNSQGKSVLNHVASLLNQAPNLKVKIAGYTDNTGNASINKSLSAARASATEKYLAAHGVAASRMTSAGYGEADPVASNATAAGRAKNRRIVFTVQGG